MTFWTDFASAIMGVHFFEFLRIFEGKDGKVLKLKIQVVELKMKKTNE